MRPEHLEALSALFDGERVDPALLAEALADRQAGEALADFAGLRVMARESLDEPGEGFYRRMAPLLDRRGLGNRAARFLLPAVAACLIAASGAAGFFLRAIVEPPDLIAVMKPPAPVQQAPVNPGWPPPTPGPDAQARSARRPEPGAPPTSELRLRFLRWQETAAGLDQHPE